jgi:hypothetical protein
MGPQVHTPPGVSPYAATVPAMSHYTPSAQMPAQPFAPSAQMPVPTQAGIQPYTPSAQMPAQPYTPSSQIPFAPSAQTAVPTQAGMPPYSSLPAQPTPQGMPAYAPATHSVHPYNAMQPYYPPTARVDLAPQQRAPRSFDMGQQAAREATIRRFVWLIVLIVAGIAGIIIATQL